MSNQTPRRRRTRGKRGAPKPCLVCGVVTPYPYCEAHIKTEYRYTAGQRSSARAQLWRARRLKITNGHCENPTCSWVDPSGSTLELDHKIPLESGGRDEYRNVWLLCRSCHRDKTSAEQKISKRRKRAATDNPLQQ